MTMAQTYLLVEIQGINPEKIKILESSRNRTLLESKRDRLNRQALSLRVPRLDALRFAVRPQ